MTRRMGSVCAYGAGVRGCDPSGELDLVTAFKDAARARLWACASGAHGQTASARSRRSVAFITVGLRKGRVSPGPSDAGLKARAKFLTAAAGLRSHPAHQRNVRRDNPL